MNEKQRTLLSKFLALLLRHRADTYGLSLDPEGYVPLTDLLTMINRERGWEWVQVEHINEIITTQQKRRYEIIDEDIRAVYGHSLAAEVRYPQIAPPTVLFHGTARRFVDAIRREGLKPMRRQYVHLTDDPDLAALTGRRRDLHPAILQLDAARAHADEHVFFGADKGVFLMKSVPPDYILPELYEEANNGL